MLNFPFSSSNTPELPLILQRYDPRRDPTFDVVPGGLGVLVYPRSAFPPIRTPFPSLLGHQRVNWSTRVHRHDLRRAPIPAELFSFSVVWFREVPRVAVWQMSRACGVGRFSPPNFGSPSSRPQSCVDEPTPFTNLQVVFGGFPHLPYLFADAPEPFLFSNKRLQKTWPRSGPCPNSGLFGLRNYQEIFGVYVSDFASRLSTSFLLTVVGGELIGTVFRVRSAPDLSMTVRL